MAMTNESASQALVLDLIRNAGSWNGFNGSRIVSALDQEAAARPATSLIILLAAFYACRAGYSEQVMRYRERNDNKSGPWI